MPSIYSAGPIAGLTYEEATEWRDYAADFLASYGIRVYSPMRAKAFLQGRGRIDVQVYQEVLASDRGITARDHHDVKNCDLMLVNFLNSHQRTIGTAVEFGWASAYGKPIITVMQREGSPADHPMIRALSDFRVETLDEALELAVAILLP